MTTVRVDWRAARDGLAHAHRGARFMTLCGATAIDERLAWPAKRRCEACGAVLARLAGSETRARFAADYVARRG